MRVRPALARVRAARDENVALAPDRATEAGAGTPGGQQRVIGQSNQAWRLISHASSGVAFGEPGRERPRSAAVAAAKRVEGQTIARNLFQVRPQAQGDTAVSAACNGTQSHVSI